MAEETKKAPKRAPKKTKEEKVAAARSLSKKDIVKKIALGAVSVMIQDTKDPKAKKALANKVQPKWSPKGSLYNLPEESELFKELTSMAKAAAKDIAAGSKSGAVSAFFNKMAEKRAGGGGGGLRDRSELGDLADLL